MIFRDARRDELARSWRCWQTMSMRRAQIEGVRVAAPWRG